MDELTIRENAAIKLGGSGSGNRGHTGGRGGKGNPGGSRPKSAVSGGPFAHWPDKDVKTPKWFEDRESWITAQKEFIEEDLGHPIDRKTAEMSAIYHVSPDAVKKALEMQKRGEPSLMNTVHHEMSDIDKLLNDAIGQNVQVYDFGREGAKYFSGTIERTFGDSGLWVKPDSGGSSILSVAAWHSLTTGSPYEVTISTAKVASFNKGARSAIRKSLES